MSREISTIAKENFERWASALETGDSQRVAELYADDGCLLGTFSDPVLVGPEEIRGYFEHFLKIKPTGALVEGTGHVVQLAENAYSHNGHYNFEVDDGEGGRKIVPARHTFDWAKNDKGLWMIKTHHSSQLPRKKK